MLTKKTQAVKQAVKFLHFEVKFEVRRRFSSDRVNGERNGESAGGVWVFLYPGRPRQASAREALEAALNGALKAA